MGRCEHLYQTGRQCDKRNGHNLTCYCRLHWKDVDIDSKQGKLQIKRIVYFRELAKLRRKIWGRA